MQRTLVDRKQHCPGLEAARVSGMAARRGGDTLSQSSGRRSGVWWNDDEDTESPNVNHSLSTAKWRPVDTVSPGFNVSFTLWLVQLQRSLTRTSWQNTTTVCPLHTILQQIFDYATSLVECLARSAACHVHSHANQSCISPHVHLVQIEMKPLAPRSIS